jgi:hypothetical protein
MENCRNNSISWPHGGRSEPTAAKPIPQYRNRFTPKTSQPAGRHSASRPILCLVASNTRANAESMQKISFSLEIQCTALLFLDNAIGSPLRLTSHDTGRIILELLCTRTAMRTTRAE